MKWYKCHLYWQIILVFGLTKNLLQVIFKWHHEILSLLLLVIVECCLFFWCCDRKPQFHCIAVSTTKFSVDWLEVFYCKNENDLFHFNPNLSQFKSRCLLNMTSKPYPWLIIIIIIVQEQQPLFCGSTVEVFLEAFVSGGEILLFNTIESRSLCVLARKLLAFSFSKIWKKKKLFSYVTLISKAI